MTNEPKKITPAIATEFFKALDENEEDMGEGAAIAKTLTGFGYDPDALDVLGDMAEALDRDDQA